MDFRSMLDQVKSAFVIGKNNPFLHGRQNSRGEEQGYREEPVYQAPQQAYAQGNPGYQAYQPPYQQAAAPYQPEAYGQQHDPFQQPYAPPQQQPYAYQPPEAPQPVWQQPAPQQSYHAPAHQPQQPTFQTQIQPDPFRAESGRNRRSQQHQAAQQPAPQAPYAPPQQAENVVPFPGVQQQPESAGVDAYVINVFNINTCRQAMSCLRKGQCTLIVMDQLIDKAEIHRYVDMLTGACYALGQNRLLYHGPRGHDRLYRPHHLQRQRPAQAAADAAVPRARHAWQRPTARERFFGPGPLWRRTADELLRPSGRAATAARGASAGRLSELAARGRASAIPLRAGAATLRAIIPQDG